MIAGISTRTVHLALQRSLIAMQRDLAVKQVEVQTGKFADPGIELGERSQSLISIATDASMLQSIFETNKLATFRLGTIHNALQAIHANVDTVQSTLIAGDLSKSGKQTAAEISRSSLEAITSTLNTSSNGQYIFGGLNTHTPPINPGNGIPAGSEADAAFLAHFGFAKTDPAAASISVADFRAFVSSEIEPLFLGADWNNIISDATDGNIQTRIALNDTAETSVSANSTGIKKTLLGLALVANFLDTDVNAEVANFIVEASTTATLAGEAEIINLQTRVGITEERVSKANARLTSQLDLLTGLGEDLSSVDPYETSLKLNSLLTQIEMSYALTQKIQNMSILKFLG